MTLPWGHSIEKISDDFILIKNDGKNIDSITENARRIIDYLCKIIPTARNYTVAYKDFVGEINQILINESNNFVGFYNGTGNETLNKIRKKYG